MPRRGADVHNVIVWSIHIFDEVYIDMIELKQLPIDDVSRARLIDVRTTIFNTDVDNLAVRVYDGTISLGQWEEDMKSLIRGLHTATAAIGKGGFENVTQSDWGRVGAEVKSQYRFLHGFAEKIAEDRDTISLAAIQARAHLYGNAGRGMANVMHAGEFAGGTRRQPGRFPALPWIPKDGSTECLNNCKCHWELIEVDRTKTRKLIQCTWVVDQQAENCETCLSRDNHIEIRKVPLDTVVPSTIGG
jgi:hypothetical protein